MAAQRRSRNAGFTLFELVIVITLVGILAASTAVIVLQGTRAYADLIARKDALFNVRIGVERMVREVREAASVLITGGGLEVTTTGGDVLLFKKGGQDINLKVNGLPPAGSTLAEGVSAVTFTIDSGSPPGWVEISLTMTDGLKYRTKAYLRKEIFYP